MLKTIFGIVLLSGLSAYASNYAPVSGECSIGDQVESLEFPTGNGSLFPKYEVGTMLSVFVGPSENLVKDEKGINLFDVAIDASDIKSGDALGTFIFRHLTANPHLKREFAFDLSNGTVVNCKF